jgi:hypothetical protein
MRKSRFLRKTAITKSQTDQIIPAESLFLSAALREPHPRSRDAFTFNQLTWQYNFNWNLMTLIILTNENIYY